MSSLSNLLVRNVLDAAESFSNEAAATQIAFNS
jgi:hypothetical protein